jgi:hypothetical protein
LQRATVRALEELVAEDDAEWWAEWAIHYQLTDVGEMASHLLTHLDHKLYFPV